MSQDLSLFQDDSDFKQMDLEAPVSADVLPAPVCVVTFRVFNGDVYTMQEDSILAFEKEFPSIDARKELLKMAKWLNKRPNARPMGPVVEKYARQWLTKIVAHGVLVSDIKENISGLDDQKVETKLSNRSHETFPLPDEVISKSFNLSPWRAGKRLPDHNGKYFRKLGAEVVVSEFRNGEWFNDYFLPSNIQDAAWRGLREPLGLDFD